MVLWCPRWRSDRGACTAGAVWWAYPATRYDNYNRPWGVGLGEGCCSPDSASFHYVKPNLMPHLTALLWDCREVSEGATEGAS